MMPFCANSSCGWPRIAQRFDRPVPGITQADLDKLIRYAWPGNIRELINVLERSVIGGTPDRIAVDLPELDTLPSQPQATVIEPGTTEPRLLTEQEMNQLERDNLALALTLADGKISGPEGAAALLGLRPSTLSSRLAKHGLK